ncbi:MAG TPA: hypothetical protein VLF21_03625, partial [Candidatus Saccharimonadales bacterium]|nr:hypothetical protein [Candidatus Saccharimonadales bacterium]
MSKVDVSAIKTWDEAIEVFPCPTCSEPWSKSPGLVKGTHIFGEGYQYNVCHTCQPDEVQGRFSGLDYGGIPHHIAERLIDRFYPVRFVVERRGSTYPVIDRADGSVVGVRALYPEEYEARRL